MRWIEMKGHSYNADHLQEFYWHDGALYIHLLGRSVPDIIPDPNGSSFRWLRDVIRDFAGGVS